MAVFGFIPVPAQSDGITASLAATTASAEITAGLGLRTIIQFSATGVAGASGYVTLTFGNATKTPTTPSATAGLAIPFNTPAIMIDLGPTFDRFKVFNASAAAINFSYQPVSRF